MWFKHDPDWQKTESGSEIGKWEAIDTHLSQGNGLDTSFFANW